MIVVPTAASQDGDFLIKSAEEPPQVARSQMSADEIDVRVDGRYEIGLILSSRIHRVDDSSVFYTDEFVRDYDLSRHGEHVPIDHRCEFAADEAHINEIEGFWNSAERLHRPYRGVDREDFPVYLAGYEYRYNYRDVHLLTILFDRPCLPQIEKGRQPKKIPNLQEKSSFRDRVVPRSTTLSVERS